MRKLCDSVQVTRRFQRSIRLDTDYRDPQSLEGFVCTSSIRTLLEEMINHVSNSGQGAFTWTGPYGCGKSSLSVALCSLLHGKETNRSTAAQIVGTELSEQLWKALPPKIHGWRVLPVVARKEEPCQIIGEALDRGRFKKPRKTSSWNESEILETLERQFKHRPRSGGGLLLIIDEMGKMLESAARDGADLYILQQIAELASRSKGRLLFIGILHQSFAEYANNLTSEIRDEWAKIQGRFVDLLVDATRDEQINLISKSITKKQPISRPNEERIRENASKTINLLNRQASPQLVEDLVDCWPLEPTVACMLGPLSRRRFGQNQRSIFGFLNSAEPFGFQDFISHASEPSLFKLEFLWDYLKTNLEPSILASPDGHRWALAVDALERCESRNAEGIYHRLVKLIALLDLVKERSNLLPTLDLLAHLLRDDFERKVVIESIETLLSWSVISFRRYMDSYVIFEGSDFDIDGSMRERMAQIDEIDFSILNELSGFHPVVAKRHYHQTGAMRWFDMNVVPLHELGTQLETNVNKHLISGVFYVAIPVQNERKTKSQEHCRQTVNRYQSVNAVVGLTPNNRQIGLLCKDLTALEMVLNESPELLGDRVARMEIESRISEIQSQLTVELSKMLKTASWTFLDSKSGEIRSKKLSQGNLNELASNLLDMRFHQCPRIHNELLNRTKPSTSAAAARNSLLRRMVRHESEARLDINRFPPEAGLYESILKSTGIHRQHRGSWCFSPPSSKNDSANVLYLWESAIAHLKDNQNRPVSVAEIYDEWRKEPIGLKEGLMPILAVALLLSRKDKLAIYREGLFIPTFTDLEIDVLVHDASDIQVRWMDIEGHSRDLLTNLAGIVQEILDDFRLDHLEPIDVARGLVAVHDRLPPWTLRTQHLSNNAKRIRQLLKKANDPNKLIFGDIQERILNAYNDESSEKNNSVENLIRDGLLELVNAYPRMLNQLRETLLTELRVHNTTQASLQELHKRADNIKHLGGDYRGEAFILRLSHFSGSNPEIESLGSLAIDKLPKDWIDQDVERASLAFAELARKFRHLESFAHINGKQNKSTAIAVIVGNSLQHKPHFKELTILEQDQPRIDEIKKEINNLLQQILGNEQEQEIVLAALSQISSTLIEE